ncbi:putative pentatricopeptide repeat-containing protein At3g49142 isoform X2 [Cryptomeria japonica]|uniref:putative pentatricopeptide repeat-containing protein At3g49142 isoform X2 n=1 Tax=Cryptomeria japonica TaxID=3369 RepID=UPI0027DA4FE6|nr:putative pentatricopeptide repeat-containing protein At3g49142 isoform X2 [Cryptomeria japonica]
MCRFSSSATRKMEDACKVFNKMSERNIISWTAMIAGFAQNGNAKKALEVFHQVQVEGMKPNSVTITSLLPACTILSAVHLGKEIHGCLVKGVFDFDVVAANALVDMYGKCSVIDYARKVFDNMSTRTANSWNAMIVGYTRNRNCDEALRLFHQMQEASVGPDSVTWNAMISGYAQNGYANEAFHFTRTMQLADVKPISITILSILPLCAKLGALQKGREIHGFVVRRELESETSVGNALLDMYAKCGNIEIANKVFHKITQRDTISWTIIIAAHGMHGRGRDSLILFQKMLQEDIKPNRITFIGVLSACSHAGLVDEGWHCFHCMIQEFSLTPWVEHYACMVDLLGRAHKLDEACELIKMMPIEPGAGVWGALLSACRVYHNIELGEYAAEQLFKLEPLNSGNYILLSNIYAESGRLDEARNIRVMMKDKGVKKTPGCSWIEIKEGIHQFFVGDVSHPETEKIYAMLEKLYQLLRAAGYVPDTRFALHDV